MAEMWFDTPLGQARLREIETAALPAKRSSLVGKVGRRMYAAAQVNRLTSDWRATDSSADGELVTSLKNLRGRSRQLCRDASYAKRAKRLVVNNVIGPTGIGMQAQVKTNDGKLIARVNDDIEDAWLEWCDASQCHIGGRLNFPDLERLLMAEIFEAGEVLVRLHPVAAGLSQIPLTLEVIESERLADEFSSAYLTAANGNHIRMGVELDPYYRPVAYHIRRRHPNEIRFAGPSVDLIERVPADQILHLALVERWPQTRGEPWLHAAARRLNDMDGYSEAEIVKARKQANESGWIQTPEDADSFGEVQEDGSVEEESEPGVYKRLNPGEEVKQPSPTAPNSAFADFMRAMLREVSAGAGPSYESISRDYSQSNYSSSRMGILDDRDEYRFIQWFMIRGFRQKLHPIWMQKAVLAKRVTTISIEAYALSMRKFQAVRYKPRGWTWVDPTTEVDAYIKAVEAGFTTNTDVIAQTAAGQDIEDILTTREQELEMMRERKLVFTTSPEVYAKEDEAPPEPGAQPNDPNTEPAPRRVFPFQRK